MLIDELAHKRPRLALSFLYLFWKSVILGVALSSPGAGYDTSTGLLFDIDRPISDVDVAPSSIEKRFFNLVRWDGIYFSQMSRDGHVYEQEWAFGIGQSTAISYLTRAIFDQNVSGIDNFVTTGVVLSHVTHWLSVLVLWSLAGSCIDSKQPGKGSIQFIAAAAHIVSPAGVFLSSPSTESTFAFLNMLGLHLYLKTRSDESSNLLRRVHLLLAGAVLGCSVLVRSNGILGGIPFLIDAIISSATLLKPTTSLSDKKTAFLNLAFTIVGGLLIASGLIFSQFLAYKEYCTGPGETRPWCHAMPPSIFTWVQSHYWNVGFLRYWTLSNIPLFLLAAPILYFLIWSGFSGCKSAWKNSATSPFVSTNVVRVALPQLILATLALTTYHVQIINRISSAYPFWYIWLASYMNSNHRMGAFSRFMMVYGIVQAALYASFLPPA